MYYSVKYFSLLWRCTKSLRRRPSSDPAPLAWVRRSLVKHVIGILECVGATEYADVLTIAIVFANEFSKFLILKLGYLLGTKNAVLIVVVA